MANTDVNMGSTSWSSMGDNRNLPGNNHMQPPHGDISGNYRMGSVYAAYIPSGPNNHWQEGSSASGNNSGGTFSAASHPRAAAASGSEWTDAVSSFPMAQRGVPSPVMDSTSGFYTYATSPPQGASSAAYNNTMELSLTDYPEGSSLNSPDHLLNNSTVRSLSPPLALAQSSETLVTMPSAVPSERIASSFTYSRQAVNAPSLLAAQAPTPASLDRELRSAIPAYLNVYWDKVDSVFPFIHKSTFDIQFEFASDQLDLLQCAMAAVATQFLEGKNHRTNGNCLHSYVWNYSKVVSDGSTLLLISSIAGH